MNSQTEPDVEYLTSEGRKGLPFSEAVRVGRGRPKVKRDLNLQIMPRSGNEETGLLGMNFLGEFPHIIEAKAGIIRWQ